MFIPSALVSRSGSGMPRACQPFSLHSNVCVGDLIAIVACGIAGIGFFFWAIHAIRKMRQFPFNYRQEGKEKPNEERERVNPHHAQSPFDNSLLVQRGVVQPPSAPERVRTRFALSEPEEELYRLSAPIRSDTWSVQGSMTTPRAPRLPPPAGGRARKSSSHRSGCHVSPTRGGAYDGYIRDVSSPQRFSGGHRSHQSMGRMNGDPTMYAY